MGDAQFEASLPPYPCSLEPVPSVGIQHLLKRRCGFLSSQNENGEFSAMGAFSFVLVIFH